VRQIGRSGSLVPCSSKLSADIRVSTTQTPELGGALMTIAESRTPRVKKAKVSDGKSELKNNCKPSKTVFRDKA
jgi:hypothetical protein